MRLGRFNISENHVVVYRDEPDMGFLDATDGLSRSNHYEYQIRWIDMPVYYKRARGNEEWNFCTDKEFAEKVTPENLVVWKKEGQVLRKDFLTGGRADLMSPDEFRESDLIDGIRHELEHTDDLYIAREIAMDHLSEDPEYYRKLRTIER